MIIEKVFSLFAPAFDWIQVEVTSACNAACTYCPRTAYKGSWADRHLPMQTFRKLESALPKTRHLHLQGWGEPFLHPDFFEMVVIGKEAGCTVGTTTNGMLLHRETIERVVESGMDIIAFSLAGTGGENDRIRRGTRLAKVLEAMRALKEEKVRRGVETPAIHVAYMLFRSGIGNLRNLPRLLEGRGVTDVVISFLDFIPDEELQSEAMAPTTEAEYEELRLRLEEVREEGRHHHLRVHHPLQAGGEREDGCSENVQGAVCIASDGSVSPCVYTNLQVRGVQNVTQGEKREYERMVFGNIQERPLGAIWRDKTYSAFRNSFHKKTLFPSCMGCPKLRGVLG